jgi:hypothetical protein
VAGYRALSGYQYRRHNTGALRLNKSFPAICSLVAAIGTATAAQLSPACGPIMSAMTKTLQADHATLTQINGQSTNGITAGGVNYLQIDGVWKVSPMTPRENQARSDENLRNAKSYVCQRLPDSSIDGIAVANYRTRTETEEDVVESTISIAKSSGLAIQVTNEFGAGGGSKSQYTTRYSYTGIHAPPIKK